MTDCNCKKEEPFEFKVGDIVSFGGAEGVVTWCVTEERYPLFVVFNHHDLEFNFNFTKDGRFCDWHTEPVLKLVRRAKKMVKKSKEGWINEDGGKFSVLSFYNKRQDADKYEASYLNSCIPATLSWEEEE